jgi:Spy/CpxP family protein refolding chaperone
MQLENNARPSFMREVTAMKATRIAALSVAILAGSGAVASAQSGAPPRQEAGQPGGRRPNMSLNGIELTDAQKAKLEQIQKKYQPEMTSIRDGMQNGGDRTEAMKNLMALRDKSRAEIRAILTPEQQAVFDKNDAEMKARMEQMRRPPTR